MTLKKHCGKAFKLLITITLSVVLSGAVGLSVSHADSISGNANPSAGYKVVDGPDGSMLYLTTSYNAGQISASAEFVPNTSGLALTKATVSLKQCTDTIYKDCTSSAVSNVITVGTNSYSLNTAPEAVVATDVYESCVSFHTSGGAWSGAPCNGYAMYGTPDWTNMPSAYGFEAFTPSFNGCIESQNNDGVTLKVEAQRSSNKVVSQALIWSPNDTTTPPDGVAWGNNWLNANTDILSVTIPLDDVVSISYQTHHAGYGYGTYEAPYNLPTCN